MADQELAKWIREENEKVNDLMNALREALAQAPEIGPERWIAEVRERFDHLRAHLIRHMALEEKAEGGYLAAVLQQRPTLGDLVDRLKHMHDELIRLMDLLHRQLEMLQPGDHLLFRDARTRLAEFMSYLEQHSDQEALITTYAFTQDIGAHD